MNKERYSITEKLKFKTVTMSTCRCGERKNMIIRFSITTATPLFNNINNNNKKY